MLNGLPDPINAISELNPEVPPSVSDVVLRGMEVSQDRRFETAREMQKTLRKAFAEMQQAMSANRGLWGPCGGCDTPAFAEDE